MNTLLDVRGLSRRFGGVQAVQDVSFSAAAGQITAIIGPNGAGKTTLFNLLSGAIVPDAGTVIYRGTDLTAAPAHRVAQAGILRTFQNIQLFPGLCARDNVMTGMHRVTRTGVLAAMLRLPSLRREEAHCRVAAESLLARFGAATVADLPVSALAFGQQRAVELARALAAQPELLLLDEPAAGLNMTETAQLGEHLRALRAEGITLVLIEHDMSLVMDIADHVVVLDRGRYVAAGPPALMQRHPEVIRIYLGDEDAGDA